jgi:hypothetical protein
MSRLIRDGTIARLRSDEGLASVCVSDAGTHQEKGRVPMADASVAARIPLVAPWVGQLPEQPVSRPCSVDVS